MKFFIVIISIFLIGCGQNAKFKTVKGDSCTIKEADGGVLINCGDGDLLIEDGSDGQNGADGIAGADGQDGSDAVILTTVNAPKNKCTKVYQGIWVENIQSGRVFDVYVNDKCSDSLGEFCDNVEPAYGSNGSISPGQGAASVCWAGSSIQLSGVKKSNGDITIYILDFN